MTDFVKDILSVPFIFGGGYLLMMLVAFLKKKLSKKKVKRLKINMLDDELLVDMYKVGIFAKKELMKRSYKSKCIKDLYQVSELDKEYLLNKYVFDNFN